MEKEINYNEGFATSTIILCILILGLAGFIVYDKVILGNNGSSETIVTSDNQNVSNNEVIETNSVSTYTTSNIAGVYEVKFDNLKTDGDSNSVSVTLSLDENGIFKYEYSQLAPLGVLGNYIIDGNQIKLTYWFTTGSSVQLNVAKGSKILTINDDGSITDDNVKYNTLVDNNIKEVKMVKSNQKVDVRLNELLAASLFNETNHEFSEPSF